MTIRICVARDASTLNELFRVRHQVFVGGGYMAPTSDARLLSHHDALPTSIHLAALVDQHVVGGLRIDLPGPVPAGADELFDFTAFMTEPERTAAVSMVCVLPEHRGARGVNRSMWQMAAYVAALHGATYMRASANPERQNMFAELGFQALAPPFRDHNAGLDVLPIMLDLRRANQRLRDFVAHQELGPFQDSLERLFVLHDETIITQGDPGDEAYLIITGEVLVTTPWGTRALGPGDVFGELALLTDRPRTATVTATTDVELMGLPRDAFHTQLHARPAAALTLLRAIATRLADALIDQQATPLIRIH